MQALEQVMSNLLSAEPPCVGEALCTIACCLFCDDAEFWLQVHSMYYLGVLLSLTGVCHSRNLHVSEKVLVQVTQAWHTHSI